MLYPIGDASWLNLFIPLSNVHPGISENAVNCFSPMNLSIWGAFDLPESESGFQIMILIHCHTCDKFQNGIREFFLSFRGGF